MEQKKALNIADYTLEWNGIKVSSEEMKWLKLNPNDACVSADALVWTKIPPGLPYYRTANYAEWRENGKLHRTDGPAVISNSGPQCWLAGIRYENEGEWAEAVKIWNKLPERHRKYALTVGYLPRITSSCIIWELGGAAHADGIPAVEYLDQTESAWYWKGRLHKLDGPAWERNGLRSYYIHGISLSEHLFKMYTELVATGKIQILPTDVGNGFRCVKPGTTKLHAEGLPALRTSVATEFWKDGKLHNESGPAKANGEYWLDGKRYLRKSSWARRVKQLKARAAQVSGIVGTPVKSAPIKMREAPAPVLKITTQRAQPVGSIKINVNISSEPPPPKSAPKPFEPSGKMVAGFMALAGLISSLEKRRKFSARPKSVEVAKVEKEVVEYATEAR